MLSSIHIQGFKGFKDTKIEGLRRVNLILGGQNSGKTSFLEALAFTLGGKNIQEKLPTHFRVDVQQQLFWKSSISQRDSSASGEAKTNLGGIGWMLCDGIAVNNSPTKPYHTGKAGGLNLTIFRDDSRIGENLYQVFPSWTPNSRDLLEAFKPISERREAEKALIAWLSEVDKRVVDIRFSPPNEVLVGLSDLPIRLNMQLLGQGINRLSVILFKLLTLSPKVALIDELENGIHYSALPIVWQGIANIARELDIQLFITTHSYECIQAAAKVFEATPEEFQAIRLERSADNNIRAICIPGEDVADMVVREREIR